MRCVLILLALTAIRVQAEDAVAATVNGDTIRLADVDALIKRFKPDGPRTGAETKALREAVVEELIAEKLIEQFLRKNTPAPDAKEIDKLMEVLTEAQKLQGRTLAQFCRETGMTEKKIRDSFDTDLRLQKYCDDRTNEATERKYFTDNLDHFRGATVRLSHLVLRLGSNPSEAEVKAAREKLRLLKADIDAGRIGFADAAKKYSVCPTARLGGDLGTIRRRDALVDEPVAAAAFTLKPFAVSEPVRSPMGIHLILVTERKPGREVTFEDSREGVKEALREALREELSAMLRSQADVKVTLP